MVSLGIFPFISIDLKYIYIYIFEHVKKKKIEYVIECKLGKEIGN